MDLPSLSERVMGELCADAELAPNGFSVAQKGPMLAVGGNLDIGGYL